MIDQAAVMQRVQQFDKKHGDDCIKVDGWLLFSDGARREPNPWGRLCEPPKDLQELSRLRVRYWEELTRNALEEFFEFRNQLIEGTKAAIAQGFPGPDSRFLDKLRKLGDDAKACQASLEEARKQLVENTPEEVSLHEQQTANNRRRNHNYLDEIASIQV